MLKAEIPTVISENQELYDKVKKLEPKLNKLVSLNRKYAIMAYHLIPFNNNKTWKY